jgi:hypothetical protein
MNMEPAISLSTLVIDVSNGSNGSNGSNVLLSPQAPLSPQSPPTVVPTTTATAVFLTINDVYELFPNASGQGGALLQLVDYTMH